MIVALIKSIKQVIPIDPGSPMDLKTEKHQDSMMLYVDGREFPPGKDEKGKVILEVQVLKGDVTDIEEILTIDEDPMKMKLLKVSESFFGGYEFEIYVDQIFKNGFANVIGYYLEEGRGLVGFSKTEKDNLHNIDVQRELYQYLIEVIFQTKKEVVRKLALPCYVLKTAENGSAEKSHFVGEPKFDANTMIPSSGTGHDLMHLATVKNIDITPVLSQYITAPLQSFLSFYIDIKETEIGWPEGSTQFKVINYNNLTTGDSSITTDVLELDMIFEERLDLPSYDHSILHELNFTDEEQQQYEVLEGTFKSIVSNEEGDSEKNKLFGYPDNIQGCVAYEAEIAKSKRDYSDEIYKDAVEWQLLLQVSPYAHKFNFFDTFGDGCIYFMIGKRDLQQGNFNDIQVVVQST